MADGSSNELPVHSFATPKYFARGLYRFTELPSDGRSLLLSFPPSPVEGSLRSQMATVLSPHITLAILSFPRAAAPLLFSSSHFLSSLRLESPPLNSRPIRSSLSPVVSLQPPPPVHSSSTFLLSFWSGLFYLFFNLVRIMFIIIFNRVQ